MEAKCKVCGAKPGSDDWADFDYISGDFYCPECNPSTEEPEGECELCEREGVDLTEHHLVPKSQGGSDDEENLAELCVSCHRKIHATFSNYELEYRFDTVEKLKQQKEINSYISWIRNTGKTHVRFKQSTRSKYL